MEPTPEDAQKKVNFAKILTILGSIIIAIATFFTAVMIRRRSLKDEVDEYFDPIDPGDE